MTVFNGDPYLEISNVFGEIRGTGTPSSRRRRASDASTKNGPSKAVAQCRIYQLDISGLISTLFTFARNHRQLLQRLDNKIAISEALGKICGGGGDYVSFYDILPSLTDTPRVPTTLF